MKVNLVGFVCNNFLKPNIVGEVLEYSLIGKYVKIKYYNERKLQMKNKYKIDWFLLDKIKDLDWYAPMTKEKLSKKLGG